MSSGGRAWQLFGSDFSYEDFRSHSAHEYRIEVLGEERVDGEACRVLRLLPLDGPYSEILAWISTKRPVFMRMDYFDEQGLWKRYQARRKKLEQRFDSWIAMEDQMLDLRTGRRTVRRVRNLLVDAQVPDEVFTLTQLTRRRMPNF
jgi:negative regulator of sigma E activity